MSSSQVSRLLLALLVLYLLPSLRSEKEGERPSLEAQEGAPQPEAEEEKKWFYLDDNRQPVGPLPLEGMKIAWNEGTLTPQRLVWCKGMAAWKEIEELPLLHEALQ